MTEANFSSGTIWTGDNLRGMNSDCVDLIYLDPPFNSNRKGIISNSHNRRLSGINSDI